MRGAAARPAGGSLSRVWWQAGKPRVHLHADNQKASQFCYSDLKAVCLPVMPLLCVIVLFHPSDAASTLLLARRAHSASSWRCERAGGRASGREAIGQHRAE